MTTKAFKAPVNLVADGPEGTVTAIISTFNVIDKDGDVVLPGAFPEGAAVPLCHWGHRWEDLPVGRGIISQDNTAAYFHGQFFLDTTAGRDTYLTVKNLGELQEYSYGFTIDDAFPAEQDGQSVRMIRKFGRVFEASPVLVGAGEGTGTLAIKQAAESSTADMTYADQAEHALASMQALLARSKSLADLRAKDGRVLSAANRGRLASLLDLLIQVQADLGDLLTATNPPDPGKARRARAAYAQLEAQLAGVWEG